MKTTQFERMLVYVDQKKIDATMENWNELIDQLNDFFGKWRGYFHEHLSLKEFSELLSQSDPGFYIQKKKMLQNPEHSHFAQSLNVKMDKLIDLVELPPHQHLVSGLKDLVVKQLGKVNASDWTQWKTLLFVNGERFEVIPELVADVTERFSYYTKNQQQNLVFLYLKRLTGLLNILHNAGYPCDKRDWPATFMRCIDTALNTNKTYGDLRLSNGENPSWNISNFVVASQMLRDDNPLLRFFSNYSDDEVDLLIEQLREVSDERDQFENL